MESLDELLDLQAGVIARRQLRARGLTDADIARMIRRREWVPVLPGVYINHTGEPRWVQEAWAAVLFSWPAALSHESALRAADGPGRHESAPTLIHVSVTRGRTLVSPPGVRIHRTAGFASRVQWNRCPPRVRYEEAALDVAALAADDFAAIAALAHAVQSRRTTARRMIESLDARERQPRRDWLAAVLHDIADGTCSVLEHAYRNRVERPHGLPRAQRQSAAPGRAGRIYRDTSYVEPLEVELDGRLFHDSAEGRNRDYDRDLLTLVGGRVTARLSYGQVFDHACWTTEQIARLLTDRGWTGRPTRCGPDCSLRA